ncbi:hypothetical protein Q9L58_010604 [Maublancomyces gigas]|uniref:Endonuclease/exonuclease/phosphatase domain-containing protein n=1 Tax=Discina gigas TaxID=1032678 RepID=A0ABR3G3N4_9PEZI
MFLPTQINAKCVTYIRKNLGLHPKTRATYEDCILSTTVTIGTTASEFINVYAANKKEAKNFLEKHKPLTDCFLAGDFNTHHPNWYGSLAPSRTGVIRASARSADFLVEWTTARQFTLLNIAETLTHYPRNGNQPTIPDLTFARNHLFTLIQGWACDEGEGGDSDHTLITTTLNIKPPSFTLR